jgi:hypothetical protein
MNNYNGMYLGIVVQNNDPDKRGRVKIYVPHISANVYKNWYQQDKDKSFAFPGGNINSDLSEIIDELKDVLPWAEPAMPLVGASGSGRYNAHLDQATVSDTPNIKTAVPPEEEIDVKSKYNLNDTGIGEAPGRKYEFESMRLNDAFTTTLSGSKNAPNNINRYSYSYKPTTYSNKAKGSFSIPNVGSHLWIFFEGGNHMNPIYFAVSTGAADWKGIYNYNGESDYPSDYENLNKEDDPQYDADTETYRNKYVINQKAGTMEFINTDNREILKLTHFSGSFKEFNNHVNIELASQNDQKLVVEDQFYTVKGFKNLYTGRDLDNIIKGDAYKKIGHLDQELHQLWKEKIQSLHDLKAQFETLRLEQTGTFAPCPVCSDPVRMDKLHSVQSRMTRHSTSSYGIEKFPSVLNSGAEGDIDVTNEVTLSLKSSYSGGMVKRAVDRNIFTQHGVNGSIFGDTCPVCGGTGESPSTMNGEWEVNPEKASLFDGLYITALEELFEIEKDLGHGGSEIVEIAKHKSETIGLVMNDLASTRIDPVGKIYRDSVVINPLGVFNSQLPSAVIEHVHVDDLPGGTLTQNICNRWNVQVGSGGVSVKTTGTVDIGGSITNIAGQQVNIGSEHEINMDSGRVSIVADILTIRQRNRGQVLVDSNLGVSQNVVVGGGMHVEGELSVNHVTAPAEIQETDPVVIFGQLLGGLSFNATLSSTLKGGHNKSGAINVGGNCTITVMNNNDTGADGEVGTTEGSNHNKVRMYPHTHHFKNLPLNLKENNDEVRKDAMDNNAGTRRDAKPVEAKSWDQKVDNTNVSNVKSTDSNDLTKTEDFKTKSCDTDNWCG